MDWNLLFSSYSAVFTNPQVLLMTLLGAAGGVLIGAIPGMTATMGVALLIPFSFGMDLIPSIGLLLGIYCGGMYGGSFQSTWGLTIRMSSVTAHPQRSAISSAF